jgi:hypothetical protein
MIEEDDFPVKNYDNLGIDDGSDVNAVEEMRSRKEEEMMSREEFAFLAATFRLLRTMVI